MNMIRKGRLSSGIAGAAAGVINGLFGAGGGMILVPMLTGFTDLKEQEVFPASVCVILPICIVTLLISGNPPDWQAALPYLLGSVGGGILAGILGKRIPTLWLHRCLGIFILWGGVRYLC